MTKTITTAVGMVLLASSFALAGQTAARPAEQPRVTQAQRSQTHQQTPKKHHKHKHHKKQHATASKR